MKRYCLNDMIDWKNRPNRKPLVVRGARQVGKTWLVREFAGTHFDNCVEINFNETPEKAQFFMGRSVQDALRLLEADQERSLIPQKTLLFLDEIQAAPEVLAQLRYFYEKMPQLHVVAAGSLLDFTFAEHEFSMPVGRIEYLFMGPMTFSEFLIAGGTQKLAEFLDQYEMGQDIPAPLHEKLIDSLKTYYIIGGMPAVINAHSAQKEWGAVYREQQSIIQTFLDDFAKYRSRLNPTRLRKVFTNIPRLVGKKLKYSHIDRQERAKDLADCIELLEMARVLYRVRHTAANGLPLGAEASAKVFKPLFLDIGLLCNALGVKPTHMHMYDRTELVNTGSATEQFIGQHLLHSGPGYEIPELHYWNRERRGSAAEVDFITAHAGNIIPVEVKAGKSGTLRSLNLFMFEKGYDLAVRFDANPPSVMDVTAKIPNKGECRFRLISLPLYLVEQFRRLATEAGA